MKTWTIDPAHSEVTFSVKHLMFSKVRGRLGAISGEIELDVDDPTSARGTVTVDLAGIDTGMGPRDEHLRSADFFDVKTYPVATFAITSIAHRSGHMYEIAGDLTIRGLTRPLVLDASFLGVFASMQGARRVGVSATTTILRKDWDLGWNVALESGGWLVSEDVKIEIDLAVEEVAQIETATDVIAA